MKENSSIVTNVTDFFANRSSYHESDDDRLDEMNKLYQSLYMYDTVLHGIFLTFGLLGNVLIIYMYSFKISKTRDDRHYILSLAYVDFLLCIFCSSLVFSKNLSPLRFSNDYACKLLMFFTNIFFTMSLFILVAICMHRYRHTCLSMAETVTTSTKLVVVGFSLAVSFVIALLKLIFYKGLKVEITQDIMGHVCSADMTVRGSEVLVLGITIFLIIVSAGGSIVMIVLYFFVAQVIFKQLDQFKVMRRQKLRFRNLYGNLRASIINAFERENTGRRSSSDAPIMQLDVISEEKPPKINEDGDNFKEIATCEKGTLRKNPSKNRSKTKTMSLAVYLSANRKARRSSLMFIAVTMVTIFSYIPTWTYVFLDAKDPTRWFKISLVSFHFLVFLRTLSALGYVTHPWIYAYYDKCLQKEIKMIIFRR